MLYVASPYTHADPDVRQRRFALACVATARMMAAGDVVYSPVAHGHVIEDVGGARLSHGDWMRQCLPILARCDGLRVLMIDGWRESSGVAQEIAYAKAADMDVEYVEVED